MIEKLSSERLEMLNTYINLNIAPILVNNIFANAFNNYVLLPADIEITHLNGHYENDSVLPPYWYQNLKMNNYNLIIIDDISKIDKKDQEKFIELLKYRKVGTFDLPKDCVIIIINNGSRDMVSDEIYSLVAII